MWSSSQAADFLDASTQNLFSNKSASVLVVTALRNNFKYVCIFYVYNKHFFSLLVISAPEVTF
jgi:hypothetical protein